MFICRCFQIDGPIGRLQRSHSQWCKHCWLRCHVVVKPLKLRTHSGWLQLCVKKCSSVIPVNEVSPANDRVVLGCKIVCVGQSHKCKCTCERCISIVGLSDEIIIDSRVVRSCVRSAINNCAVFSKSQICYSNRNSWIVVPVSLVSKTTHSHQWSLLHCFNAELIVV